MMMQHLVFKDHGDARCKGWEWGDVSPTAAHRYDLVMLDGKWFTGSVSFTDEEDEWDFLSFKDGLLHSFDDEPALRELNDTELRWFMNGKNHRTTGPARISPDRPAEFVLNCKGYAIDDWLEKIDASPAEKVLLKMQWG